LIRIFKATTIKNLNIFGAREGFLFEFPNLNIVYKFGGILLLGLAHLLAARFRFSLPGMVTRYRAPP
jgi:hypothetical protein